MIKNFDVIVIGGGPGGYICAIRAAQLGLNVAIVEKENLGGICLNWGCIPTKALLKASEIYHTITHEAEEFGITTSKPKVDISKLIARSRGVSAKLSGGVGFLMKKNKITVIEGSASFKDKTTLRVTIGKKTEEITFKNAVIATGARAREIPNVLEADGKNIWTYRNALTPTDLPKSMLVIGAGAIGVEFASFYHTLGTKVDIIETQSRILPIEDVEISNILGQSLKKQGINILLNSKTKSLKTTSKGVKATLEIKGKDEIRTYDKVLIAIGVQGNVENIGLENLGIKAINGEIEVDKFYRTGKGNIYAIGDVIGAPLLAHVASHEGIIAAETIAGKKPHQMDYNNVAGCTYSHPQVASVGLTEALAKEKGINIKIGRFNYQANGKALAIGEEDGMVKTIFDAETGELLGAHIIGAEATEMISTFVLARTLETTEEDIINTCLPHPTLSEMLAESVLDSEGRALNA